MVRRVVGVHRSDAPSPRLSRVVQAVFAVFLTAYLSAGFILWNWQDLLIFPAPTVDSYVLDQVAGRVGAEVIHVAASDGTILYGWHRPATGARAVLFFHGNAETVADRTPLHDFLVEKGWDVVVIAYRGYPGSPGSPSEDGLRLDARAAWEYVTQTLHIPKERIIIHGKSLGGGVSAMLAEEVEPAGLVMESTFLSIPDVAWSKFPVYPVDHLVKHPFLTKERAGMIDCPVLVMHADRDQTIPVEHGRQLAKLFPDVRYVEVHGLGHAETLPLVDVDARIAYEKFLDEIAAL